MALPPNSVTPSTALVAAAWASSLGLPAGPHLPPNYADWADTGFVTTGTIVGGFPELNIPLRRPVVQFSCYGGRTPQSYKPNWGLAGEFAERLVNGVYVHEFPLLTIRSPYRQVYLAGLVCRLEPHEMPEPDTEWARLDVDIEVRWIEREAAG